MSAKLATLRQQIEEREQAIHRHKHRIAQHQRSLRQRSRDRLATPTSIATVFFCGLTLGLLKDKDTLKRLSKLRVPGSIRALLLPWLTSLLQGFLLKRFSSSGLPTPRKAQSQQKKTSHNPRSTPHRGNPGRDHPKNIRPANHDSTQQTFEDGKKANRLSQWVITVSTGGIFLLLFCYTLYTLAAYLIPVSLAILFSFLFKPVIRKLRQMRIPEVAGAACSILFLLSIMTASFYTLSQPASEWMDKAPVIAREIANKLQSISKPLEDISGTLEDISKPLRDIQQTTKKVEQMASLDNEVKSEPVEVKIERPGLPTRLLVETPSVLLSIGIFFILLYFLLATSDVLLAKIVQTLPHFHDKKQAARIIYDIQKDTSYYLLTMLAINIVLGTASSIALYLLGIPNAILWGVMIGLLNFAPYLGPLISISILTLVAILSLDTLVDALWVPVTLAALQILEGQFITPHVMGRRFALSPTLVFLSIIFWGGLWGVAGALMAVPLIVSFKVICENIEPLNPIATLLEH